MKPESKLKLQKQGLSTGFIRFFRLLSSKITDLFQPEEVEVTFTGEGKKMSYTYTKVAHKQVA